MPSALRPFPVRYCITCQELIDAQTEKRLRVVRMSKLSNDLRK
jgi:hypothetical protein